jgi:hypothetical protein
VLRWRNRYHTLNNTSHHTGKYASCWRQDTFLIGKAIADGVEGEESHTGLESSTQYQGRAAGIDRADAIAPGDIGDDGERVPGSAGSRL